MTKTIVVGYVGNDATINTVNNKTVINFNVAHTETWKDNTGEKQSKTTWFQVAKWTDKTAVAQYIKKGTLVSVEGKVEARAYTTKDGTQGVSLVLTASEIELHGSRGEQQTQNTTAAEPVSVSDDVVSDLPF
jgi:single-strand DNA-binding protein